MKGSPPNCRPECLLSSDCSQSESCIRQRCVNPCAERPCGIGTRCEIHNHNPICTCESGLTGDPFIGCHRIEEPTVVPLDPINVCDPTPCGLHSICVVEGKRPVCSCLADMIGSPPFCRPQCVLNSDCSHNEACINQKCQNPCASDICGRNTECRVQTHIPICNCMPGFHGDAFTECTQVIPQEDQKTPANPCDGACGQNSQCSIIDGQRFSCSCIPPYRGDPYNAGCRPECVSSNECPSHLSCLNYICTNPCPGVCGKSTICEVKNHIVTCVCEPGTTGNPFSSCYKEKAVIPIPEDPCSKDTCGPHSLCRARDGRPVCSCLPEMIGSPPFCRPECVVNSDCSNSLTCIDNKCKDPCENHRACGINSECRVHNHNLFCSCLPNYVGDPFISCSPKGKFRLIFFCFKNLMIISYFFVNSRSNQSMRATKSMRCEQQV